jgi:glycosyltransferase involved in cell wall biosynthesis
MDIHTGAGQAAARGPETRAGAAPGRGAGRGWDGVTVTVVLPALNEAAALPVALGTFPPGIDLVVVDNGSTDATAEVAEAHGARVVREPRRGFGAACWAGVLASPHADVIAFADADGSFDGADLGAVAGPVLRGETDLMLGSRVLGRRDPGAMSPLAVAENRALGLLSGVLFGVRVSDLGPFRALRREVLLGLGVEDRGSGWPLEMLGRAAAAGLRIGEVPVRYRRRAGGSSKVSGSLPGTVRAVVAMLGVCWRLRRPRGGRVPEVAGR